MGFRLFVYFVLRILALEKIKPMCGGLVCVLDVLKLLVFSLVISFVCYGLG